MSPEGAQQFSRQRPSGVEIALVMVNAHGLPPEARYVTLTAVNHVVRPSRVAHTPWLTAAFIPRAPNAVREPAGIRAVREEAGGRIGGESGWQQAVALICLPCLSSARRRNEEAENLQPKWNSGRYA